MDFLVIYAVLMTITAIATAGTLSNIKDRNKILKNALDNSRKRTNKGVEEVIRLSNIIKYNDKIIRQLSLEVEEILDEVIYDPKNDNIMLYGDLVYIGQL